MQPVIFGRMEDGSVVEMYTLKTETAECEILTYGGALRSLKVLDKNNNMVDVLLGFDTMEDYIKQDGYIGALVGRYANRIGNSCFELNGKQYQLYANDGKNHLHGGKVGFDKQLWNVKSATEDTLVLTLFSEDGNEGYPGNLNVTVTYHLNGSDLSIEYNAVSDADTVCNLTNHAYFNLSGHSNGSIEDNTICIFADYYTPTYAESITTGEIASVENTPMDLRNHIEIGKYADSDFEQLKLAGGYDHNWVLNGEAGVLRLVAEAKSKATGIIMKTFTTQPGIQFYSGNYLDGCPNGKNGAVYKKRSGFCLETQCYPDTVHHKNFPSTILKAGEVYSHKTVYSFSLDR